MAHRSGLRLWYSGSMHQVSNVTGHSTAACKKMLITCIYKHTALHKRHEICVCCLHGQDAERVTYVEERSAASRRTALINDIKR